MSRHRRLRKTKRSPQRLARLWRNRASRRLRRAIREAGAPLTVVVAAFLIAITGLAAPGATASTAATAQACPITAQRVAQCVIASPGAFGTVDVAAAGPHPGIPWAVSDPHGALMGYVNLYELASVGDGGKDPGGLVCSTYKFQANVACFTPRGNLILQATGPNGPTGRPQVLTPARILQLNVLLGALRAAGMTARDWLALAAWIHAREARR